MPEIDKIIYLDNAATTFPKPTCVYQAADEFYRRYGGNAGRGANPLARKCSELIDDTRAALADWLGAPSPQQVVLVPSATIALNLAILGTKMRSGDVVYVTPFEHNSVLRPLEHLRQSRGIVVQEMPFDRQTMACQLEQLNAQFQMDPPALVCITQASNTCGLMPPITKIARLAKEINPDATVIVDGAQVAGLYPLALDGGLIDTYIFSGHKSLHGPYGVAGLVLASEWRPALSLFGGTGTVSESVAMPDVLPSAYESGSHNVWAIAGLKAALEWLQETGREAIVTHTQDLAEKLRTELEKTTSIQVYAPPKKEPWCGILAFTVEDVRPQAIEAALGAKGIVIRAGLHCAPWAHRWLGTMEGSGAVRVSVGWFNRTPNVKLFLAQIRTMILGGVM